MTERFTFRFTFPGVLTVTDNQAQWDGQYRMDGSSITGPDTLEMNKAAKDYLNGLI